MTDAATMEAEFARADALPKPDPRVDMRHPWDDGIFRALALGHGFTPACINQDPEVDHGCWDWDPTGMIDDEPRPAQAERSTMPTFFFGAADPNHLTIRWIGVSYHRKGSRRRLIARAKDMPETVKLAAVGVEAGKVFAETAFDGLTITRMDARDDGYVDFVLDFADEEMEMDQTARRHWYEARMVQPRHTGRFGGVDHGASGHVLAELRRGNEVALRLIWIKGHKRPAAGVRGFGHVYSPGSLYVINGRGYSQASILDEGRISRTRLLEHAQAIDKAMGAGTAELLDPMRTLVMVETPEGEGKTA